MGRINVTFPIFADSNVQHQRACVSHVRLPYSRDFDFLFLQLEITASFQYDMFTLVFVLMFLHPCGRGNSATSDA